MLLEIHNRLQQIKAVLSDVAFGGVSILAVGDYTNYLLLAKPQYSVMLCQPIPFWFIVG